MPGGGYPQGETSLALQGELLVVGNPLEDEPGAVCVFVRDLGGPDAYGPAHCFTASDGAADDAFGSSVALSRRTLAVGAPQHLGLVDGPGAVYLFGFPVPRILAAKGGPVQR